ncbi:hypothetical protein P4284_11335 [Bacillus swezeyi]|uniref:hypothetical protein n=1 Tax=Bacillus swezeyi TaxID=1925020 RepID=UPI002E1EBC49|nr:hypothetical protein [Bacillus swezeyi]MED2977285.1 hypothetical protein [Bacillus swezeyi]
MKEYKGDQAIGITCGFGIGLLIGAAFGSLAYCLSVGGFVGKHGRSHFDFWILST